MERLRKILAIASVLLALVGWIVWLPPLDDPRGESILKIAFTLVLLSMGLEQLSKRGPSQPPGSDSR